MKPTAMPSLAIPSLTGVRSTETEVRGQSLSLGCSLLKRVSGSARTQISYQVASEGSAGGQLYLFSLIDNLLKGAASQAIENFNRLQDLPVAMGLELMEGNL